MRLIETWNDELYSMAEFFRDAIEQAVYDGKLRISPFSSFPKGCCDMASEMLAQYLHDNGIETIVVNGKDKKDNSRHAWLRTFDGVNIDITAYQFGGNIPKTIVGVENELIHGRFSTNIIEEEPMYLDDNIYDEKYSNSLNRRKRDLCVAYNILRDFYLEQK